MLQKKIPLILLVVIQGIRIFASNSTDSLINLLNTGNRLALFTTFNTALEEAEKSNDIDSYQKLANNIGRTIAETGNPACVEKMKAFESQFLAKKIDMTDYYRYLGVCYRYNFDYDNALKSYQKSVLLGLQTQADSALNIAVQLGEIGVVYQFRQPPNQDSAVIYNQAALDIYLKYDSVSLIIDGYKSLSSALMAVGKPQRSLSALKSAIQYFDPDKTYSKAEEESFVNLFGSIGTMYTYLKMPRQALPYLTKALNTKTLAILGITISP